MDKSHVQSKVTEEIAKIDAFDNYHGITKENIESFLVEPFTVLVDPDDLETTIRPMWVVLQERKDINEGYSIAHDPSSNEWAVIEHAGTDKQFIAVVWGETLAEALASM